MSESSDTLTDGVRWGSRIAIVGVIIAALSLVASVVGIGSADPLYWVTTFLSIIAVIGAAIRGARTTDTDDDGTVNYKHADSDGDGIPDTEESTSDTDSDGTPEYKDTDADNDGVHDSKKETVDTDGDGASDSEEEHSAFRHAGGVISAMAGVFVIGYGVESGTLWILLVGVVAVVIGALGVISDTQRTE